MSKNLYDTLKDTKSLILMPKDTDCFQLSPTWDLCLQVYLDFVWQLFFHSNLCILFFSSIHDHTNSHCFLKVLDGKLKETLYNWPSESEPEKPLEVKSTSYVGRDEVAYINGNINIADTNV